MALSSSQTCTLYVVRHGETVWNTEKRLQGHADSPLTEKGLQQAREAAKRLKAVEFVAAYASDSPRAFRTAEIIAAERGLAVATSQLLRERTFGRFEGKLVEEFRQELGELVAQYESLPTQEQFTTSSHPDIESDEQIVSRLLRYFREIALVHPGKNVLVASHGGMLRALLVHLGYGDYQTLPHGSIQNLATVVLKSDGVEFELVETWGVNKKGDT